MLCIIYIYNLYIYYLVFLGEILRVFINLCILIVILNFGIKERL